MNNKRLGIDSTGTWTPHQYSIDAGWDADCVAATAVRGLSEADEDGLSEAEGAALLDWCKGRYPEIVTAAVSRAGYADMITDTADNHITLSVIDTECDEALAAVKKYLPEGAAVEFTGAL